MILFRTLTLSSKVAHLPLQTNKQKMYVDLCLRADVEETAGIIRGELDNLISRWRNEAPDEGRYQES